MLGALQEIVTCPDMLEDNVSVLGVTLHQLGVTVSVRVSVCELEELWLETLSVVEAVPPGATVIVEEAG